MLCNEELLKKEATAASEIVGLDGVFKIMNTKLPVYVLISVTKEHFCIPLAVCISKSQNHEAIKLFLSTVKLEIEKVLETEWNPVVMIDDGAPELCFFKMFAAITDGPACTSN